MPDIFIKQKWFERNPALTLSALIILVCALFDLLLGTAFIAPSAEIPHPFYHHGLKKSFSSTFRWGRAKTKIYTNSLGLCDLSARVVALSTEKYRIIVIGDSFIQGVGVKYEDSCANVIQQLLGSKYEVLNAAVMSYSPKLYFLKTQYLLEHEKIKADELIVFIDISDPQDDLTYSSFNPYSDNYLINILKFFHPWMREHSIIYHSFYPGALNAISWIKAAFGRSPQVFGPFGKHYYDVRARWTTDNNEYLNWGKKGLFINAFNMNLLKELCKRHNVKLKIAVYPWPHQILSHDILSIQASFWADYSKENHIPFINLFPDFISNAPPQETVRKYFIEGDVHWNAMGHAFVAEKTVDFIKKEGHK